MRGCLGQSTASPVASSASSLGGAPFTISSSEEGRIKMRRLLKDEGAMGILWYEAVKVKGLIWGWATVWLHVRRRGRSHVVGSVPTFPFYFFCSAIRGGLKR